jgi:dTDP-glucose 4,6-dehydratase
VTGAAGFIGSHFVRHWRTHHPDDRVVAADALTYAGNRANLADVEPGTVFRQADIRDQGAIADLLREFRVDVVVNFAAESHNSYAVLRPVEFFDTNVAGTVALLEAARHTGVGRFHHISTCEVYGDLPLDSPDSFTEDSPYRPRTPYNASKAAADHAVRAYGLTYDLPVTITNCANNYGSHQFPEKVIPLFTTNALQGRSLPLYESSRNRREWLHVTDHCAAIEAVLDRGRAGATYNIGSGVEADVETIADLVLDHLGLPSALKTTVPDRPSHDRRYLLDSTLLREELGWRPLVTFEEGLRRTIDWYRDHPEWWEPLVGRSPVAEQTAWAGR